jgi:hypothetical protein
VLIRNANLYYLMAAHRRQVAIKRLQEGSIPLTTVLRALRPNEQPNAETLHQILKPPEFFMGTQVGRGGAGRGGAGRGGAGRGGAGRGGAGRGGAADSMPPQRRAG